MKEYLIQEADLVNLANVVREKTGGTAPLSFDGIVEGVAGISVGVELNFKVVGSVVEPVSPTENTIWVNTDVEIAGYKFSATGPENPIVGMVWIAVGNSSTVAFSMIDDDSVTIYPMSAKQYVSGAWVDKEAKSYQNGEWVDWVTYLFNMGNECTDITGGWSAFSCCTDASLYSAGCVKGTDRLTIKTSSNRGSAAFGTNKMVDLTPYSYVEFVVPYLKDCCKFGVSKYKSTSTWDNTASHASPTGGLTNAAVRVDVRNLSGSYYVWFGDWHTAYTEECQVTEIRLV